MEQSMDPTEIQRLAALGQAPGQCAECASYRLDGKPPHLHKPECSLAESTEESIDRWIRERRQA